MRVAILVLTAVTAAAVVGEVVEALLHLRRQRQVTFRQSQLSSRKLRRYWVIQRPPLNSPIRLGVGSLPKVRTVHPNLNPPLVQEMKTLMAIRRKVGGHLETVTKTVEIIRGMEALRSENPRREPTRDPG